MPTFCCCGNHLDDKTSVKTTVSPCGCDAPGPGRRQRRVQIGIPEYCFRDQYEERTRLGLPLETDMEKEIRSKWQ